MVKLPCDECKGQCCGPAPMGKVEFNYIKEKHGIPDGYKAIQFSTAESRENYVIVCEDKSNFNCAFLKDGRCLIYDDRPQICRDFGEIEDLPCPFIKGFKN